jgi:hypothetical protein
VHLYERISVCLSLSLPSKIIFLLFCTGVKLGLSPQLGTKIKVFDSNAEHIWTNDTAFREELSNKELHSLPDIIRVIKSKKKRWKSYVARMRQ